MWVKRGIPQKFYAENSSTANARRRKILSTGVSLMLWNAWKLFGGSAPYRSIKETPEKILQRGKKVYSMTESLKNSTAWQKSLQQQLTQKFDGKKGGNVSSLKNSTA